VKLRFIFLSFFFCIATSFFAQQTIYDETTVVYKHQLYGGALIHSNGWGLHIQKGKNKTAFNTRILGFEIVGMKHPKEVRSYNPYYNDTKSYIYGKLNSFYLIRPTLGYKRMLFDKIRESAVEVGLVYSIGPALGFTKPVYFEIGYSTDPAIGYEYLITEKFDPVNHTADNIFGKASSLMGFDELKFHPGITGKFGAYFDYASDRTVIKGIETGITFDAFSKKVQILANDLNKQFYFNFYISAHFGKKYNNLK
jgi:hypothetical protein